VFTREAMAIEVDQGITGEEVADIPRRIVSERGAPKRIRLDNGPEFVSNALDRWAYSNGVTLDFSRPGRPTDNAYAESFNAIVRMECLGMHWFMDLDDAKRKVEDWRQEYNEVRPHSAIGDRTPMALISGLGAHPEAEQVPEALN